MRLLLVLPAEIRKGSYSAHSLHLCPPLGVQIIASLTPKDIDVELIDENVEEIDFSRDYDFVGISSTSATAKRAYKIASIYKAKNTKVIMGGIHPTVCPNEALKYCDSVVIGEAENVWGKIIRDYRSGKLNKKYKSNRPADLKNYSKINSNLIDGKKYLCSNAVETSRGCPYSCKFCSISNVFGEKYRYRPIKDVIEQLISSNSTEVIFIDDNIIGDFDRAKKLFNELVKLNIKWSGQATLDIATNEELLNLAKKSGCVSLFIGIESCDEKTLKEICNKPITSIDRICAIKKIQRAGISVFASFMFGFDSETDNIFKKTHDFISDADPQLIRLAALTPYPGTKMYKSFLKEKKIREGFWLNNDYFFQNLPVYKLKNYSLLTLKDGTFYILNNFYSLKSIFRRAIRTRINLIYFFGMSLGLRHAAIGFQSKGNSLFNIIIKIYSKIL